jgi:peptidoglycan/xylan/chitin deacetylase (PgdA/CDA1 family)
MPKRILCSYGVDVDAVAGWLGSYGGEDSPSDISRGLFAGTHGTRRMLKLFDKYNIKATWFIPGHSLRPFQKNVLWYAMQAMRLVFMAIRMRTRQT